MPDDAPHFDDAGRLIAPAYDDVYFSSDDGLAETTHVFLNGNHLAERFAELMANQTFVIGETGFGTGLNFLAAWALFEQHAPQGAELVFASVEGLPLDEASIRRALSPWPQFKEKLEAMLAQWGGFFPGVHRLRFADGRVRLNLLVGEAAQALALLESPVDAWFLDGFAPSRNPAMWSDEVFLHVGRCSTGGTTLATYTAAGFVRRGLQAVGFEIAKQPGYGTKRDMTAGNFATKNAATVSPTTYQPVPQPTDTALVIGGSIAGAFVARALADRGIAVTVIERQALRDGELPTLCPRVAVLQPKINDISDATGRWLRGGYADAVRLLTSDAAIAERSGWQPCGTFQAAYDDRSTRRLRRFVDQFEATGLCRWIDSDQTESLVGLALSVGGVFVDRAGILRPAGLCAALLSHPRVQVLDQTQATRLERDGDGWVVQTDRGNGLCASQVIVANALDAQSFKQTANLELKPVRGQVTLLPSADEADGLSALRCPLFYGGYLLPKLGGTQTLGASFVPGDSDTQWRDEERRETCRKLARLLPDEAERLRGIDQSAGWVGLRTTTPRHRCYAEQVDDGLYVSLGHGSHGIASASAAAAHLAALITNDVRMTR